MVKSQKSGKESKTPPAVGISVSSKGPFKANLEIIEGLEKLRRKNELEKQRGKAMAYQKAIATLKSYDQEIKSSKQVKGLPGIGDGIAKKVQEYIDKGKFRDVIDPFGKEKMKALTELEQIWGVGPAGALKLYDQGYTSIEKLRKDNSPLTSLQKIGLEFYEDLKEKMPRSEAQQLSDYVKKVALELFPDKDIRVETCGSFRRGKEMCGDIDILITSMPKSKSGGTWLEELEEINGILPKLTTALKKGPNGPFLVHRLGSDRIAQTGSQTYMGICQIGKGHKRRRIDIKVYPRSQYGYAILYFTGSAQFNKNMRLKALQHGFSLSDAGLYKLGHKGGYGEGVTSSEQTDEYMKLGKSLGELVKKKGEVSEEDIFKAFGMKNYKPNERDL